METPYRTFEGYMLYKVNRRKRGVPFVRAPKTCSLALVLPPSFESPFTLPPKNEKLLTAGKLPPCFGFTASVKVVTAKKRKTAYCRKITAIFCFYRLRQSRYRQKTKNRLPPKNYCRMALPPRLCPPKKALPTITLFISHSAHKKGTVCLKKNLNASRPCVTR